MQSHSVIQISDLHLSHRYAYTYPNWQAVAGYINQRQPELVINTGDFILDAPEDVVDLELGRVEMDKLTVPWKALPGDHDIGAPPPQPSPEIIRIVPWLADYFANQARLDRYLALFGEDHWSVEVGEWLLIGINTMIFELGLDHEEVQWTFLEEQLAQSDGRPVAIFTHRPPVVCSFNDEMTVTKSIPAPSRCRLWTMIQGHNVRLFGAGHLHYYKTWQTQGITIVAAPALSRRQNDWTSVDGVDGNGIVEYTFTGESVAFRRIVPEGVGLLESLPRSILEWPTRPLEQEQE